MNSVASWETLPVAAAPYSRNRRYDEMLKDVVFDLDVLQLRSVDRPQTATY